MKPVHIPQKRGGLGQVYAIDATAHIPQKRGGADKRDVQYQPTSLRRGTGNGRRWWLEVVVIDEHKIIDQ